MRAMKLRELEGMAAKLLETARKLPPGPDRSNILHEIGRFRLRIVSLQGVGLRPGRRAEGEREMSKPNSKWTPDETEAAVDSGMSALKRLKANEGERV